MKNVLLVGSSSSSCQNFYNHYKNEFNFIRLSRNREFSDFAFYYTFGKLCPVSICISGNGIFA